MAIGVGDRIPDVEIRTVVHGNPNVTTSGALLGSGRVVLFAVPGAFTPGCSNVHLPSFVETAADLSAAGVDKVVCLAVNDPFVMAAWGESQGVGEEIVLACDGNAEFTRAVGMDVDASRGGLGLRSRRYAMVLEDGIVTAFLPEEDGFSVSASTGQCVLEVLRAPAGDDGADALVSQGRGDSAGGASA